MVFVTFLQPTQDGDGAGGIRLVHHYGLESAFQCLVLFEILLVFVQGSGTDATELSTSQGWFQDVGRIHGSFTLTGTHKRVDFVDKEDDVAVRFGHFVDDRFQSFLELTLVLGTGYECPHIEGEELFVFQVLGHVTPKDTLCQSLYDGCLTGTRFTDKHRIVLGASAQDLEYTTYFLVTTDYRVQLTGTCGFYQVDGIFAQRLVCVLARLRSHLLSLAQFVDGCAEVFFVHSRILQYGAGCAFDIQQRQEQCFQGYILVAQPF